MEIDALNKIYLQFKLAHQVISVTPFGNGYINDTYRLDTNDPNGQKYLLQRINHEIFKDIAGMMNNINLVTDHIRQKLTAKEIAEGHTTLQVVKTQSGQSFYQDNEGNYWRVYDFIEELKSYDTPSSLEQIYQGAKCYGRFLSQLDDFSVGTLCVTIDHFHDLKDRLHKLKKAVHLNPQGRRVEVYEELEYIEKTADELSTIQYLGKQAAIPLRIIHNDTKFNNVMIDEGGVGKCVVDLDTVMPGYVHYDFGDGVRTTISETKEDESNLSEIKISLDRFEAFASGYLSSSRHILTTTEIDHLAIAGTLLSFLMGIRFLTDYILGDVYYKIINPAHNLICARAQLDLTRKMLVALPEMKEIIRKLTV